LPGWVAGWPWNQWPDARGMGGRITVESVVRCSWNGWPDDRGKGQGRGRRAGGRALDPRRAEEPPVLLPGRTQQRHRLIAGAAQPTTVSQAAGLSALGLRSPGSSSAAPTAGAALRLCRVEEGAGAHRLPRRGRWALLLGAVPTGEETTGSTPDSAHGGVLPRQSAGGQPPALTAQ